MSSFSSSFLLLLFYKQPDRTPLFTDHTEKRKEGWWVCWKENYSCWDLHSESLRFTWFSFFFNVFCFWWVCVCVCCCWLGGWGWGRLFFWPGRYPPFFFFLFLFINSLTVLVQVKWLISKFPVLKRNAIIINFLFISPHQSSAHKWDWQKKNKIVLPVGMITLIQQCVNIAFFKCQMHFSHNAVSLYAKWQHRLNKLCLNGVRCVIQH